MKDQPLNSGDDKKEPPRPRTIPDDFIWDEETQGWYPPGDPSTYDAEAEAWRREFEEMRRRGDFAGGGLISVDQLRAAGALDVPAEWRKSLGSERRFLLPGFEEHDEDESQSAPPDDSEYDESTPLPDGDD